MNSLLVNMTLLENEPTPELAEECRRCADSYLLNFRISKDVYTLTVNRINEIMLEVDDG